MLMLTTVATNAGEYLPILTEGKVWHCLYKTLEMSGEDPQRFEISVSGDTIVNGNTCKRLVFRDSCSGKRITDVAAYEQNGKVFAYCYEKATPDAGNEDTPTLLMDFTLKKGESRNDEYESYEVLDVDYISAGGANRLRLKVNGGSNSGKYTYWIEGIGATEDNWMTLIMRPTNGQRVLLESCYENEELLFKNNEIPDDMISRISEIFKTSLSDVSVNRVYSLDGRYLGMSESGLPHGIYVVNGKKVVR